MHVNRLFLFSKFIWGGGFPCYFLVVDGFRYGCGSISLLECKVLGSIHIRKGPNRLGFVGI
jgi:NADH:ubiquinone oxidoreductase subunit H